jgi:DNA-binding response OmpR family regulator
MFQSSLLKSKKKTKTGEKKKILVVDSDESLREMLIQLLAEEGFSVLPAADGLEALEFAKLTRFDLVLMELNLPLRDGWKTFEELNEEDPLLPIVLITARPNQLFPALASGVGALLEKPLNFTRLIQTIRNLLQEPTKIRLARLSGQPANFSYVPPEEGIFAGDLAHA